MFRRFPNLFCSQPRLRVVEAEAILDGKREVVSDGFVDDAFIVDYVRVFDTDF